MRMLLSVLLLLLGAGRQSTFEDEFERVEMIHETNQMTTSANPNWWLSSGGMLIVENGVGKTIQGDAPTDNRWRLRYAQTKPIDTDNGYHPQNIFRLVMRSQWLDARQQVYFRIQRDQLSDSSYRNGSNGIFLMNRYQDADNLYYVGIRVDGKAIVKKKTQGHYYTLAYTQVYSGTYDRALNPNLLPKAAFIGLRSEVRTLPDDTVEIRVYLDKGREEKWELVLTAVDDGVSYGGSPLLHPGYGGIRTDFMDVEFDNYRMITLSDTTSH